MSNSPNLQNPPNPWRICIAPMLDWTDRHYRYFMRLMTKKTRLYTEMITTGALLHGNAARFLTYHPAEYPLALQVGGCDPQALAQCARLAQAYGYAEINLNVGCPSERVQSGKFGACLMAEPELVAQCVAEMRAACIIPVTVKTRLGIDEQDSYEFLLQFIQTIADAGCKEVIIHARKAWLSGLSPKENREIPPLCYERVYQLKKDFPHLTIIINGGITTLMDMQAHLIQLDGVMVGRIAYHQPYLFANIDQQLFSSEHPIHTRQQIVTDLLPYIEEQLTQGIRLHHITRHLLNLFNGEPRARYWRRSLTQAAIQPAAQGLKLLQSTLADM